MKERQKKKKVICNDSIKKYVMELLKGQLTETIDISDIARLLNLEISDDLLPVGFYRATTLRGDTDRVYYESGSVNGNSPPMFKFINGVPCIIQQLSEPGIPYEINLTFPRNKKCEKRIKDWISFIVMKNNEYWGRFKKYIVKIGKNGNFMPNKKKVPMRSFNDVFIPDDIEESIKSHIEEYINKSDWYDEHRIPNHFGILLHGAPGGGKSSLAAAIADYIDADLFYMSADDLPMIDQYFGNMEWDRQSKYSVLCIEDIDASTLSTRGESKSVLITSSDPDTGSQTKSIATVLNTLDGANSPSKVIYILTTNHIENIDPALYRPGRCDLVVELPFVNSNSFSKFTKAFYGKASTIDVKRKNVSFAYLQTRVMIGDTMEQLEQYMSSED